jgi:hypothetical protein
MLSGTPKEFRRPPAHQLELLKGLYSLPPCVGTNILDEMLARKCWPATTQRPQFAIDPQRLPPCAGMDIFEETKAVLAGKCWPSARPR